MKKFLLILTLLIFSLPLMAEPKNQGGYAGTPPGFYDDIDPNAADNDEEQIIEQSHTNSSYNGEQTIHEYSDDDEIMIAPTEQSKSTKNYAQIYNNLEPADFSYLHNIDPDQYYDMKDTSWSVYPLLRLNSPIY